MNIVGKNILRILEDRRMTQSHLAELAGMDQGGISRIISVRANPNLSSIQRIAKALDISAHQLIVENSIDSIGPVSGEEKAFILELRKLRRKSDREAVKVVMQALVDKPGK